MLRITLHQMRQNIGRLTAAGIAVLIGTAFIAATLLAGQVFIASQESSMTTKLAQADLAVRSMSYKDNTYNYTAISRDFVKQLQSVEGVEDIAVADGTGLNLIAGTRTEYLPVTSYSTLERLRTYDISEGAAPTGTDQIAVPPKVAERLGKAIGDQVTVDRFGSSGESPSAKTFTITGFVSDPRGAYAESGGTSVMTFEALSALEDLAPADSLDSEYFTSVVLLGISESITSNESAMTALTQDIQKLSGDRSVQTIEQVAQEQLVMISGDSQIITNMVLAFAFLALLVASLVISNTFQVLVAQRTKTLAMLRCVGASKSQIRRSVVIEAFILGLVSSVIGILSGIALVQIILWVVAALEISQSVPTTVNITPATIWLPLVAGILTTILASFVPAKNATQVSPLAALRPIEGGNEVRRTGKFRTICAALFVFAGVALFAFAFSTADSDPGIGLLVGIAGGALSFIGLIISAVLWVPALVGAVGKLFERFGASAQIATANIRRNPRRTASTATALFIGVTLVAMLSVGASTARATLNKELDQQFPLDIEMTFPQGSTVDVNQLNAIKKIDGIKSAAAVRSIPIAAAVDNKDYSGYETGNVLEYSQDVVANLRDSASADALSESKVLTSLWASPQQNGTEVYFVSQKTAETANQFAPSDPEVSLTDGADGSELTKVQDSEAWKDRVTLTSVGSSGSNSYAVDSQTFAQLVSKLGYTESDISASVVYVRVDSPNDASAAVDELREMFSEQDVQFDGSVLQRNDFQKVIDVMLLVLVGLLGVAVVIALVGVANTLSLSVIERRRESATLRAVGMSRKQLRGSLALEGMLIAGIGAFVGVLLGGIYGWLGSDLVLGAMTEPVFTVRWMDIALIFAVSIGAGLLASILPGRAAAKTSPVEALAVD